MTRSQLDFTANPTRLLIVVVLVILAVGLASQVLPEGIDWHYSFRPASLSLLAAKSPFDVEGFYGAPWGLIPLLPFAILPENIGRAALFVLGLGTFAYTAYRLGAKPLTMAAFLLSPPVLH